MQKSCRDWGLLETPGLLMRSNWKKWLLETKRAKPGRGTSAPRSAWKQTCQGSSTAGMVKAKALLLNFLGKESVTPSGLTLSHVASAADVTLWSNLPKRKYADSFLAFQTTKQPQGYWVLLMLAAGVEVTHRGNERDWDPETGSVGAKDSIQGPARWLSS